MDRILYEYDLNATTWVYISSLMTIAVYFKFGRLFSVRNLDLVALLCLSPGLLLLARGPQLEHFGYVWLFCVGAFFLVRMLLDPLMLRRPLLEPNLSTGGLTFMGVSLLVFLMTNVVAREPLETDLVGSRRADQLLRRREAVPAEDYLGRHGPSYPLLYLVANLPNRALVTLDESLPAEEEQQMIDTATARTMAILSHLAIVFGMVLIGYRHYGKIGTGIATASLYLIVPATAILVSRVDHALPAALLIWAVFMYRRPLIAGVLLALATGAVYFPLFLLPLWLSFYWQRGRARFLVGFLSTLVVLVATLAWTSSSFAAFGEQLVHMVDWLRLRPAEQSGFWSFHDPAYRMPVLAAFVALSLSLSIWPAQKNLGTLLACSAAIMLAAQFWIVPDGGLYIAWYLPLLLLTIFRPNLEDRVAQTMIPTGWFARRSPAPIPVEQAA